MHKNLESKLKTIRNGYEKYIVENYDSSFKPLFRPPEGRLNIRGIKNILKNEINIENPQIKICKRKPISFGAILLTLNSHGSFMAYENKSRAKDRVYNVDILLAPLIPDSETKSIIWFINYLVEKYVLTRYPREFDGDYRLELAGLRNVEIAIYKFLMPEFSTNSNRVILDTKSLEEFKGYTVSGIVPGSQVFTPDLAFNLTDVVYGYNLELGLHRLGLFHIDRAMMTPTIRDQSEVVQERVVVRLLRRYLKHTSRELRTVLFYYLRALLRGMDVLKIHNLYLLKNSGDTCDLCHPFNRMSFQSEEEYLMVLDEISSRIDSLHQ